MKSYMVVDYVFILVFGAAIIVRSHERVPDLNYYLAQVGCVIGFAVMIYHVAYRRGLTKGREKK